MAWHSLASLDTTPIALGAFFGGLSVFVALRRFIRREIGSLESQGHLEMPFQSANWRVLNQYLSAYRGRTRLITAAFTLIGAIIGAALGLVLALIDVWIH